MKNYMMIKQRVADFAQFQAAFDELLPRRREYGLIDIGTFREASEPDTIVVLMEVTDVARAKEYWHSQVLEAGRRKAGVVGPLQAGTDQVWLTNGPVIQEHPDQAERRDSGVHGRSWPRVARCPAVAALHRSAGLRNDSRSTVKRSLVVRTADD